MPEYPTTKDSETGVIHFIHCPNPAPEEIRDQEDSELNTRISEVFTRVTSQVRI